jgi:ABC-type transport system substrate-binding protein
VTADDGEFSFDRYKGAAAKLLKDRVRDVEIVDPGRVRFHLREPWPDFMTFYGTSATGAAWIVPRKYVEKVGEDGFKKAPIEVYVTKSGIYSSGVVPEIETLFERQARELDRKKREGMLHQIQQIMHDRAMRVPVYELAFLWGIGPRVEEACVDHIKGFSYSAPYEDLRLKRDSR